MRDRLPVDRVSFDEQGAGIFDARAGFPDGVAERIADAVRSFADLRTGDLILEIGAGTGLIGQWLAQPPYRYLGLDNSRPMLDTCRTRLPAGAVLITADANRPWPVPDRTARIIFGSRVFQLLDPDHLVAEANRVAHPAGAVLLHGKVEREPDSPKAVLRRKLHERLTAHGYRPRPAGRLLARILDRAAATGGTVLPPAVVTSWRRVVRPIDPIEEWRQTYSMGGITPSAAVAAAVLAELTNWVTATYGDPTAPVPTTESYVLQGIALPSTREAT
ncbi:MAG TPA: methyltransferase domain-containing protein [Natronosporangium sp.]